MTTPLTDHEGNVLLCEVCKQESAVGVASVPGIPVSVAYGRRCLDANAHPYDLVVANTALSLPWEALDDYESATDVLAGLNVWWKDIVADTLSHLGKTEEQFRADVIDCARDMDLALNEEDDS